MAHLDFDFDEHEITETELSTLHLSDDPLVNHGRIMAAVARLQKETHEGFAQVRSLNARLKRIERLLYGSAGTAVFMIAQWIAAKMGFHGFGAP